ncbi:MAG: hypothetical protein PHC90_12940 [Syntrophorhabdaceae bacterium]|nr:hypothetical protein [Syntrophorhabdaceae bacterium]
MKLLNMSVLVLLTAVFTAPSYAGPACDPCTKEAVQLDEQSKNLLNIDLHSLRWLLGASSDSYLLHESLVQENQLGAIEALEKNGYARLELVDGLPGGTRGTFLRIIPTAKGQDIINTLTRQHNK